MKVIFVQYRHLDTNSGIHVFNIANHLTRLGVECVVCVPSGKEHTPHLGTALFEVFDFRDVVSHPSIVADASLIHAWTPRSVVARFTQRLLRINPLPYVVQLEDNEESILEAATGLPVALLERFPAFVLDLFAPPYLSHPRRTRSFLAASAGLTIIIESLRKFCPPDHPQQLIWAGFEKGLDWHRSPDPAIRRQLGVAATDFVVVYPGNVHVANRHEVAQLYDAVLDLRRQGKPFRLIRTGSDFAPIPGRHLVGFRRQECIELGHIPRTSLPDVLSIADAFVQPGHPGDFNDFRFPAKVPEFLAAGKPVILPHTNIGLHLRDGQDCLLLSRGDTVDMADKLLTLYADSRLRDRIGSAGRRFAAQHLEWGTIASRLPAFYERVLQRA